MVLLVVNSQNLKILKYHIFTKSIIILSVISSKSGNEAEKIKIFEESIKISNILSLVNNIEQYHKI